MSELAASWTVLVYMGADGEQEAVLDVGVFNDLREIREVLPTDRVNVGVQMDLRLFPPVRFTIDPSGGFSSVRRLRESSTGSPRTLFNFLKWGHETLTARRYAVVLWGHGLGVGHIARMVSSQADVVYDDLNGLTAKELAGATRRFADLRGGQKLEILGFDACLMSAVELAHELRHSVECLVGSQVTLPAETGWPYAQILTRLRASPALTARAFGKIIVDEVIRSYTPKDNVTQTLLTLDASDRFVQKFGKLVRALTAAIADDDSALRSVRRAIDSTAYSEVREFLDAEELCRKLLRRVRVPAVRRAAAAALAALRTGRAPLVAAHRTRGARVSRLRGAGLFCRTVPETPETLSVVMGNERQEPGDIESLTDERYRTMRFAVDTGWPAFMDLFERRLGALARGRRTRRSGASNPRRRTAGP
jgi:hypothetical protein